MRELALVAIGGVFGGLAGFLLAAGQGVTLDGHDHGDPAHHGAAHSAATVGPAVGAGGAAGHDHGGAAHALPAEAAPRIALALHRDPVSGWNLEVQTENFRFAPQAAGAPHVPGEGHAHLYAGGVKLARLYAPWVHLPQLPAEGPLRVTLNANDHGALTVDGREIAAEIALPE